MGKRSWGLQHFVLLSPPLGIPRFAIVTREGFRESGSKRNYSLSQCAPDLGRGLGWRKGGFVSTKQDFYRAVILVMRWATDAALRHAVMERFVKTW